MSLIIFASGLLTANPQSTRFFKENNTYLGDYVPASFKVHVINAIPRQTGLVEHKNGKIFCYQDVEKKTLMGYFDFVTCKVYRNNKIVGEIDSSADGTGFYQPLNTSPWNQEFSIEKKGDDFNVLKGKYRIKSGCIKAKYENMMMAAVENCLLVHFYYFNDLK